MSGGLKTGVALAVALASCGGIAGAAAPPGGVDVLNYAVDMRLDFARHELAGSTAITFRARAPGQTQLRLDANALKVSAATLAGRTLDFTTRDGAIIVDLPRPLRAGETATATFTYAGRPSRGLIFEGEAAYTGYFTCDWMMCALEPFGDKASLSLSIDSPAGMTAVGPGTLVSRKSAGQGRERWVWREKRGYSAYLFGFAVGRFQQWTERAGPNRLVVFSAGASPERLAALFEPTADMLAFFQEKAGFPLPHARYVQVHTPGSDAQEAANFSLVGDRVVAPRLAEPQEDWAIAHELAHQWWGNSITCTDLSQFWLNEGVTTFMVAAWKERRWGHQAYERELALLRRRWDDAIAANGDRPLTHAGPWPSLAERRAIQYSKGALFLDTLRKEVGDEAFWRAFQAYSRAHRGGVVDSRDLQASFERASGRSLTVLFDTWVY